ncbi:hypothetical protein H8K32_12255 [Undibacterium jejuense]|uniref:Uncharacterized protein n=1 Tax=Undibacterium jejuense TaxID=1344949 RepID=A0A923HL55_9BURK|nr:hypothetical protein [Undibacterium jejuense]MBC3862879.1 hypothetical protein [Undibacterium jejuense]
MVTCQLANWYWTRLALWLEATTDDILVVVMRPSRYIESPMSEQMGRNSHLLREI